jgi:hypothetical protein
MNRFHGFYLFLVVSCLLTSCSNDNAVDPERFILTVIQGSGSGSYLEGEQVEIIADAPPEGQVFALWTGDTNHVADVNAANTTISMPAQAVSVTATFELDTSGNLAPQVTAGEDQFLDLPTKTIHLRGTVTDDGISSGGLTYTWTKESGPGAVIFNHVDALASNATIEVAGIYVLRLSVSDGLLESYDELTVKVVDSGRLTLPVVLTEVPKPTADMSNYTNIYTIDLEAFGIYNDGTHALETSQGLNAALQHAKTILANRIIFPEGTYLINPDDPVVIDHQDTIIDLNGATLQIETNALDGYHIVRVDDGALNLRLTNGIIRGDKDTHDFSAGGTQEWGHVLLLKSGYNLEIDQLTITNGTGDGLVTSSNIWSGTSQHYVYIDNLEQGAFTPQGDKAASTEKTRSIEAYDISNHDGQFEFGYTAGYQGYPYVFDREYQAYFFDENMIFVVKMDNIQYKKYDIPNGAKYMHLEFNQPSVTSDLGYCGFIVNFRPPRHVHIHHNTVVQNRRNGLTVGGGQIMLIENNLFKENGGTNPGYGVDYEDGWDLMQDIVFKNNSFENNQHGALVACAGTELIFEGNVFENTFYVWDRVHNATFRNNQVINSHVTYRTRSGAISIHDNVYEYARGPEIIYDREDIPTVILSDESIYNSSYMTNAYLLRANVVFDVSRHIYSSTFEDCNIEIGGAESFNNTFIHSTITDSAWNSHDSNTFTNCQIDNFYTSSHTVTDLIQFDGCTLTDVEVDVRNFQDQTQMDVVIDHCDIEMNNTSLVTIQSERLNLLQITNSTIDNNSEEPLYNNQNGVEPAQTVTIENNIYE